MREPEQHNWHQRTWVRVLVLLLLPLIVGGLYLISTRLALRKPTPVPVAPENSVVE